MGSTRIDFMKGAGLAVAATYTEGKIGYLNTDSFSGSQTYDVTRGKTIGTPGYSSISLTWIRGILEDEHCIAPSDVKWVVAKNDSSAAVA